jgi:hypothetical protein
MDNAAQPKNYIAITIKECFDIEAQVFKPRASFKTYLQNIISGTASMIMGYIDHVSH